MKSADSGIRLAEMMAAMSMATDLGMGQRVETALASCVVAMRLGEAFKVDDETLRDVYYHALLRYIGCNAETDLMAALFGDELALRHDFAALDTGEPTEIVGLVVHYIQQANAGQPPSRQEELVASGLAALPALMQESFAGHCEVAQRLATRLQLADSLIASLGQVYERWDGKGLTRGLRCEEVSPCVLIVSLARDAVVWQRIGGTEAAVATARTRADGAYHPEMVDCLCRQPHTIMAGIDEEPSWESVLALEPGRQDRLTEEEFDAACEAVADFADIKSPYTLGHSRGVSALAVGAARRSGLVEGDVVSVRRAGLLHDVGRAGVSAGIWGKEGRLSEREWERVRLHSYFTERVLARPQPLGRLGSLAALHHERMDGSGYHRGLPAQMLSPAARILAAADTYQAMTETRPHRPALTADQAAEELGAEVRAGRLDGDAVHAVLAEAGHRVPKVHRERPAGLSRREIEVLRLVCQGFSNRDMAAQLYLAPDTVKHHIQHIYNKLGVSTRAGATLFAMENALL